MSTASEQPCNRRMPPMGSTSAGDAPSGAEGTGRRDPERPRPARTLGVDCGGSGTRAVLLVGGEEAQRSEHAPMNALLQVDLVERLAAIVEHSPAHLVGVGLPGVRTAGAAAGLGRALARRIDAPAYVFSDVESAHRGAFLGDPGIVVLAGTGSAALGDDGRGTRASAGGHGFLLGDDGSAYWIGRTALRAALAASEGTGPPTNLGAEIEQRTGHSPESLVAMVHRRPGEREWLAMLAPVVDASTDELAMSILAEAGRRLARLALTLRRQLGELPVACVGGVFRSPAVRCSFTAHCDNIPALADPAIGAAVAARLALEARGAAGARPR